MRAAAQRVQLVGLGQEVGMPLIHVQMSAGRTAEQKHALLLAVTDAVHRSLDVAPESIRVWITEFQPTEFMAGGILLADRK
jgi:4-oxalocrotonate tautomerase